MRLTAKIHILYLKQIKIYNIGEYYCTNDSDNKIQDDDFTISTYRKTFITFGLPIKLWENPINTNEFYNVYEVNKDRSCFTFSSINSSNAAS